MSPTPETGALPPAGTRLRAACRRRRHDLLAAAALALFAFAVFANSLGGDFVYDDTVQIVGNHLIRDHRYLGEALTSDVWAFKGERPVAWSNYWRPTFVAWLIACHRLFGLASTLGWHLASVLLHALVTVLGYALLRRLGLLPAPAFAAALLFAVHPVHVESVAWISGSPDLLMSAGALGALLCLLGRRAAAGAWLAAGALYLLALGAKEPAVVWPAIAGGVLWAAGRRRGDPAMRRRALAATLTFGLLAAGYLAVRLTAIGHLQAVTATRLDAAALAANGARLLGFYLRQALWPFDLAPTYPLRALPAGDLTGAALLVLPAAIVALILLALWWTRRDPRYAAAGGLFLLPLLPALNITAFHDEQLVHDRYLYLPLYGLLALAALPLAGVARRRWAIVAGALLLAVPLALATVRDNRTWSSELALWRRAVARDPGAAHAWAHYGLASREAGDDRRAADAFERALAIRPQASAYLGRAALALDAGRLDAAERDLQAVLDERWDPRAVESLAIVRQRRGDLEGAAEILLDGRRRVPHRRCSMTVNLGVLRYRAGQKDEAFAWLEEAETLADREPIASCLRAAYFLGELHREQGRAEAARDAYRRYLARSAGLPDPLTARLRAIAERRLREERGR